MTCKNCGGDMGGDGYTEVRHCENVDLIGEGHEPDANPVYCAAVPAAPSSVAAPFDLNGFARRSDKMMEKHGFHGFEPIALAIAEELLGVLAEPAPAQDERSDALEAIHQYAFEVGGTEGGGYMLEPEELNEVVRRANEPYEDVLRSLACSLGAGGYNAPTVDPAVFEQKIRWGIDQLARPAQTAPAKDEREAFKRALHSQKVFKLSSATMSAAEWAWFARPAQTEQQPIATWMGMDWGAQKQILAQLSHLEPGTDLYTTPIAQNAPQPEQSGLVEAAKAFADAARKNIYPCPDKPNSLSGKLQALDDAIDAALSAQGDKP